MADKDVKTPVSDFSIRALIAGREIMWLLVLLTSGLLALAGAKSTGFDVVLGNLNTKTAEIAVSEAVPAVSNMFSGATNVIVTTGKGWIQGMAPEGTLNTPFGSWTWNSNSNSESAEGTEPGTGSGAGSESGGGQTEQETQSEACQWGVSNFTRLALQAWQGGDPDTAAAALSKAPANECAAGELRALVDQFEFARNSMNNASTPAEFQLSVGQTRQINPRWAGSYAAEAFFKAMQWLQQGNWSNAKTVLTGSTIQVVQVVDKKLALLNSAGDILAVQNDFGYGFTGQANITREAAAQLATTLGGKLDEPGNSIQVAGSYIPSSLPAVPVPNLTKYEGSPPTPVPDQQGSSQPATPETGTTCSFDAGTGMHVDEWVQHILKIEWATFATLNPGVDGRAMSSNTYNVPPGACK